MKLKITKRAFKVAFMLILGLYLNACGNRNDFDGMGVFESDEWIVSSEIGGKILNINVKEGQSVVKGEILAKIDSKSLELKRKKLELELEFARIEKGRLERLYKANATSKQNLDQITLRFDSLQNEIEIIQDSIDKTFIIAPSDSIVLNKYAYEGELATPNRALLKLADVKNLRLKAYLNSMDLSRLKLGDSVKVRIDYKGEGAKNNYREYKGVVSFIAREAEFSPKSIMTKDERENLVYMVKIDVENDGLIKIGSYGEVLLEPKK